MTDLNGFTLGVTLSNGSDLNIDIEPITINKDDHLSSTGAYQLNNSNDNSDLGVIAFNQDYPGEWEYLGESLDSDVQEQIAERILFNINGESEDTFYVQAFYNGGMNSFQIIPNEGHFGIVYDGIIIAEIQNNEGWEQTSGEPLDKDTFETITEAIESKYE